MKRVLFIGEALEKEVNEMNRKLSITIAITIITIMAFGIVLPISANDSTLGEKHADMGTVILYNSTKDDCLECHSNILQNEIISSVNTYHLLHFDQNGLNCVYCHRADDSLLTHKQVSDEICAECHASPVSRAVPYGAKAILVNDTKPPISTPEPTPVSTPILTPANEPLMFWYKRATETAKEAANITPTPASTPVPTPTTTPTPPVPQEESGNSVLGIAEVILNPIIDFFGRFFG